MTATHSAAQYIRDYYKVPAKRGLRVRYSGSGPAREGTIVGFRGPYLRVRLDGDKQPGTYHPTWQITYLDGAA